MVGLQTLNLAIGVRVPASQPTISNPKRRLLFFFFFFAASSTHCNLNHSIAALATYWVQ